METPAAVTIEERAEGSVAVLTGDWTATELGGAVAHLREVMHDHPELKLDMHAIGRCDTSGAFAILEAARNRLPREQIAARPEIARLLELVDRASQASPTRDFPTNARKAGEFSLPRLSFGTSLIFVFIVRVWMVPIHPPSLLGVNVPITDIALPPSIAVLGV